MGAFVNLVGMKFGRLTVLECVGKDKHGNYLWRCRCECENEIIVRSCNLTSGHTQSCGCLRRGGHLPTHGLAGTPIYNVWLNIKDRCFNPNDQAYPRYGGRGITMFADWVNDFQAFYDYVSALPHFGEARYSLDRINNDKNYEPGNLRWATATEQARNTRRNIIVEYQGEQMTLPEAAELSGINYKTLNTRYCRGDRGERLFRPVQK